MDEKFLREFPPGGANQVAEGEEEGKWNKQVQKGQQSNSLIKVHQGQTLKQPHHFRSTEKYSYWPSHFVVELIKQAR